MKKILILLLFSILISCKYTNKTSGCNNLECANKNEINNKFNELVEKIVKRNSLKSYPDINNIPE